MGVILITLFSLAVVGGIGYLAAELGVAEQEIERLRKESSYSKELVALYEQEEREFKELNRKIPQRVTGFSRGKHKT